MASDGGVPRLPSFLSILSLALPSETAFGCRLGGFGSGSGEIAREDLYFMSVPVVLGRLGVWKNQSVVNLFAFSLSFFSSGEIGCFCSLNSPLFLLVVHVLCFLYCRSACLQQRLIWSMLTTPCSPSTMIHAKRLDEVDEDGIELSIIIQTRSNGRSLKIHQVINYKQKGRQKKKRESEE